MSSLNPQSEAFAILNCRRLPGRLTTTQTAMMLGFPEHDLPVLVNAGLLKPLGTPAANAPKYFAAAEIAAHAQEILWLSRATKMVSKFWKEKNEEKKARKHEDSPTA